MSEFQDRPLSIYHYYHTLIDKYTAIAETLKSEIADLEKELCDLHDKTLKLVDSIKEKFSVNLLDYEEFNSNLFSTGVFWKLAKGLFVNRGNDYEMVSDLWDLYNLANKQKQLHTKVYEYKKAILISKLSPSDYRKIIKDFYFNVQKHLILEGEGYAFEGHLGWICFNRVKIKGTRKRLDYRKTKIKKQELIDNGQIPYNKDDDEWCQSHGIKYKGVDYRVYLDNEYGYEFCLIHTNVLKYRYKITTTSYKSNKIRNKSDDDILNECTKAEDVIDYDIDLRRKINIAVKLNKILYTKFIRNENQKSINYRSLDRKNR